MLILKKLRGCLLSESGGEIVFRFRGCFISGQTGDEKKKPETEMGVVQKFQKIEKVVETEDGKSKNIAFPCGS